MTPNPTQRLKGLPGDSESQIVFVFSLVKRAKSSSGDERVHRLADDVRQFAP